MKVRRTIEEKFDSRLKLLELEDGRKIIRYKLEDYDLNYLRDIINDTKYIKRMKDFKKRFPSPELRERIEKIVEQYSDFLKKLIENSIGNLSYYKEIFPTNTRYMIDNTKIVVSEKFNEQFIVKILNFHPSMNMIYLDYSPKIDTKNTYSLGIKDIVIEDVDNIIYPIENIEPMIFDKEYIEKIRKDMEEPKLKEFLKSTFIGEFIERMNDEENPIKDKYGDIVEFDYVDLVVVIPFGWKWINKNNWKERVEDMICKMDVDEESIDEILDKEIIFEDRKMRKYSIFLIG